MPDASTEPITLRQITDPSDPAIAAFGELQDRTYFEPDMLIPAAYLVRLLEWQSPERRNLLLVAEQAGRVVGGTVFHAFPQVGTGFSSYMATAQQVRGQGVARLLHDRRMALLDEAVGGHVAGVFIDVVAPQRLTPRELAEERAVGSDPVRRRAVFAHLGFRQVDVTYQQPAGGENGGPVTNMDLLYCPRVPADRVPAALVLGTMGAYWHAWLGEARRDHALAALAAQAAPDGTFGLIDPTGA
ncbi:GNAT superfamily N-acetyltransferase [Deinococcus metalli]|uniref:N-acetyltransferase n=1 Tax=Deinococcus metalli TaxID=1141878 RepID=A0A7W8KLQ8_9DEIO|nr:GNAT family N-acetyltransferase [Deinococcus metalli]MBB5378914.1 GNAT superfamily N-acetyltransferase [Deinococcus metalli]GHF62710.1 N-acetyltransferase [Deinococcus metalli]